MRKCVCSCGAGLPSVRDWGWREERQVQLRLQAPPLPCPGGPARPVLVHFKAPEPGGGAPDTGKVKGEHRREWRGARSGDGERLPWPCQALGCHPGKGGRQVARPLSPVRPVLTATLPKLKFAQGS